MPKKPNTPDTGAPQYKPLFRRYPFLSKEERKKLEITPHYHVEKETGLTKWCYHQCRGLFTNWQFWAGITLTFPLEHALWEKVWPFKLLTDWMGL